ncbi:MAG: hypothetical protein HDS42_02255 [Bacteroides sp.]|nr:hypothetical protein [Bacteroides sp.]
MKEKTLAKCHFFLITAVTLLMLFTSVSCSDDSSNFNYQTMLPSRADVVGAQSLILSPGAQTRADDEYYAFQEAGLYKVDENGNVSAVGIFMSNEGGTLEKEGRIIPKNLTKLNDRFVLLSSCSIKFDYTIPLEYDIIVDLTTGKIYKFNNFKSFSHYGVYSRMVSDSRFLIWSDYAKILGELNIDNETATYRQLTNDEGKGFINPRGYGYVNQLPNGVILSQLSGHTADGTYLCDEEMGILYPNGGYDYLQDLCKADFYYVLKDKAAIASIDHKRNFSLSFIEFGNSSNDTKVIPTDKIVLDNYGTVNQGYYETDNSIILSIGDSYSYSIIIFNKQSNKLSEFTPSFSEQMDIYPYAYYKGRVWDIFTEKGAQGVKALWINPDTRESGSFDLDLQGVDVDKIERYYDSGKVVIYGTRRSDTAYVVATLDLETEKTKIEFSIPEHETITLIPLN